ncbi:hypothetical protein NKG94_22075 [Micromonospora sp. M12]
MLAQRLAALLGEAGPTGSLLMTSRTSRVGQESSEALVAARVAQLRGASTVLELPSDLARPATRDLAGARLGFVLSDGAEAACARLAAECSVSRAAVVLAAWSLVLGRRAGCRISSSATPSPVRGWSRSGVC